MKRRYVLAPEAALDLAQIWRYVKTRSNPKMADSVESVIRDKVVFLAGTPGTGAKIYFLGEDSLVGG